MNNNYINIFTEIINNIRNYDIDDLISVEKIINYFKVVKNVRKDLTLSEEKALLDIILDNAIYRRYLLCSFKLRYPKESYSLYLLEKRFINYVKSEPIDFDEFGEILYAIYYLSSLIDEKTVHIAHNILSFYKGIISKEEFLQYEKKEAIDNIYNDITDINGNYQKYKR